MIFFASARNFYHRLKRQSRGSGLIVRCLEVQRKVLKQAHQKLVLLLSKIYFFILKAMEKQTHTLGLQIWKKKKVPSMLFYIENSKTRGQTV